MSQKFLSDVVLSTLTTGSMLKLDSNGKIVEAVDGTDYISTSATGYFTASSGSGIYYSGDVRIGTYQTTVAPDAKLHIFDYQTTEPKLLIEDGNTGDASMQFKISTQSYTLGIDNSDSDKFVLSAGDVLGTGNLLEITSGGLAAFQNSVLVKGTLYVNNQEQIQQGDTEKIATFQNLGTERGYFEVTDTGKGYFYADGFKTGATTVGFLKSDGTVDTGDFFSGAYSDLSGTPTLGTMAAASANDYKTSDQTEDYVAGELTYSNISGTPTLGTAAAADTTDFDAAGEAQDVQDNLDSLVGTLGTAAYTASTDYATASHTHSIFTGNSGYIEAGGNNAAVFSITSRDRRAIKDLPRTYPRGLYLDFKNQDIFPEIGEGGYRGQMIWRSYGSETDLSGGQPLQMVYTQSGNLYFRLGTGLDTWQEEFQHIATRQWVSDQSYLTSLPAHEHDARYYTETEMDTFLSGKLSTSGGTVTGMTIFEDGLRIGTGNHNNNGRASITFGEGSPTTDSMYIEYDGENLSGNNNALIFGSESAGDIFKITFGGSVLIGTNAVATESYVTTALSNYKTSDDTETYIATELLSYTPTSSFGTNAFTSYSDHTGLYDTAGSAGAVETAVNTRIDEEVLPAVSDNATGVDNNRAAITALGTDKLAKSGGTMTGTLEWDTSAGATNTHAKIVYGQSPSPDGSLNGMAQVANYGADGYGLLLHVGYGESDNGGIKITDDGVVVWGASDENVFTVIDEDSRSERFRIDNSGNIAASGNITAAGGISSAYLTNSGGAKLEIQNGVDGTPDRGIYMWNIEDPNWGIYMSTSGAGKSLGGGTATAGIDGVAEHAIRFRVNDNSAQAGFIWENSSEVALMQMNGGSGHLYVNGRIYPSNQTTDYVDSTRIKNWDVAHGWGNHAGLYDLAGSAAAVQTWVGEQNFATDAAIGTAISNLVDSSPAALNTLNELAAALGDDPNFATTVTNNIGAVNTRIDEEVFPALADIQTDVDGKLDATAKAADSNLLDGINSSQFVRSDQNSVTIGRHLDANTTWTNSALTLFLGWYGGKVVIGNDNDGGHDYASALGGSTIPIINKSYFYKTAKFEEDIQIDGNVNFLAGVGTWITSDAMSDSMGWNGNHGVYIGSTARGSSSYVYGDGTYYINGNNYDLWHEGNFDPATKENAGAAAGVNDRIDTEIAPQLIDHDSRITTNRNEITTKANAVHTHSAADITSGTLDGARLPWDESDGFSGTYSLVWRATNDLYTSSWLQIRGSDDTLLTRSISANGKLSVGNGMWVNGNNATVYNNYNENLRLPPAGNNVSVIAFRATGEGGEPSSSILGYSDRHEVRIGGTWRERIYAGTTSINNTLVVFGDALPDVDRTRDLGRADNRWRIVFCEILDSAGQHEKNLQNPEGEKSVGEYETGTVLVWKGGKNVPCTDAADHMRMGIAVKGIDSPLIQGAEPVLVTGSVNEGDYLVTSRKEGHAEAISPEFMRQHGLYDCVLGKALESAEGESHLVKTWINI